MFFKSSFTVTLGEHEENRNITEQVEDILRGWGPVSVSGSLLVFVKHTTCAISVNEKESGLSKDLLNAMARIAPTSSEEYYYEHDDLVVREENLDKDRVERRNGHAHLKALFIGPSETIPIIDGKLELGTWQQILFFDFDDLGERQERTISITGTLEH